MQFRCHQCFGVIDFEAIAHLDVYSDLCWIQCDVCQAAFGPSCGMDRVANPNPHGYFGCPLRHDIVSPLLRPPTFMITSR